MFVTFITILIFYIFRFGHGQDEIPLSNNNLLVGVGIYPPFVAKYSDLSKPMIVQKYRGLLIEVLEIFRIDTGMNYQLIENDDVPYARNGTALSGQIEDLRNQRIQIAAGPFISEAVNPADGLEFTLPYTVSHGFGVLMKTPKYLSSGYQTSYTFYMNYVLNLDANVWGTITACYVAASFLWFLIDRITGCCGPRDTYNVWSLIAKLTFANWLLFFVIVTALIIDDDNVQMHRNANVENLYSLDALLDKQDDSVRFLMVNNSRAALYFRRMGELERNFVESQLQTFYGKPLSSITSEEREIFNGLGQQRKGYEKFSQMNENDFVRNVEQAKMIIESDARVTPYRKTFFIGDFSEIVNAISSDCTFEAFDSKVGNNSFAAVVPVNSRLKTLFDEVILKLRNQRKIQQMEYKWFIANGKNCTGGMGTQLHRLDWLFAALCISAALSIAAGLAVGGLFATLESCCLLCCRHKESEFTHDSTPVMMVQTNGFH